MFHCYIMNIFYTIFYIFHYIALLSSTCIESIIIFILDHFVTVFSNIALRLHHNTHVASYYFTFEHTYYSIYNHTMTTKLFNGKC